MPMLDAAVDAAARERVAGGAQAQPTSVLGGAGIAPARVSEMAARLTRAGLTNVHACTPRSDWVISPHGFVGTPAVPLMDLSIGGPARQLHGS